MYVVILQVLTKRRLRKDCGNSTEIPRKQCEKTAEMLRKSLRSSDSEEMLKNCEDAAETVRKDYGSSADIVRTKCGTTAVPLRMLHRSTLLGHQRFCSIFRTRLKHETDQETDH